jgi:hypothetical protein
MVTLTAVPDVDDAPELSLEDLRALSDDEVTDSVLTWAGRVAAGEARLLAFLGEFDARGQWAGHPSCASWLSWELAIGMKTASEKVRVARALRVLPVTRAAFERGELSYTQVRAVTRVAEPGSEAELVLAARSCSGEQIERLARGINRAKAAEGSQKDTAPQYGVSVRYEYDGTAVLTARLPAEQAAIVLAAVETCHEQLELAAQRESSAEDSSPDGFTEEQQSSPPESSGESSAEDGLVSASPEAEVSGESSAEDLANATAGALPDWLAELSKPTPIGKTRPTISRQQALLQVAQDWLDAQSYSVRRRAKPRLTAQLDPLSGWARLHNGEMLPPEVAKTLSLTQFDLGRREREVNLPLRQFLGAVDGERCRFPGCRHTRHLKAHHVIWWSHRGPTDLANLVLVCHRHPSVDSRGAIHADPAPRSHLYGPHGCRHAAAGPTRPAGVFRGRYRSRRAGHR